MNNSVLIKEVNDYSDKTTLEKNNDNISFDEENEIYNYQQETICKTDSIFFENESSKVNCENYFILKSAADTNDKKTKESKQSKTSRCPIEGCNGKGNTRAGKKSHSSVKYCPVANGRKEDRTPTEENLSSDDEKCQDNSAKKELRNQNSSEFKNSVIVTLSEELNTFKINAINLEKTINELNDSLSSIKFENISLKNRSKQV